VDVSEESQDRHLWQDESTTNNTPTYERVILGHTFCLSSSHVSNLIANNAVSLGVKPKELNVYQNTYLSSMPEGVYAGEKPYQYNQYGKCFVQKSHLTNHEKTHTGEKPYKCSYCGKTFLWMSRLIQQEMIHTGEKPYQCSQCVKSFCQKSNLTTHEIIYIGKKALSVYSMWKNL
jgi:uncharacterized Zn-finger protein